MSITRWSQAPCRPPANWPWLAWESGAPAIGRVLLSKAEEAALARRLRDNNNLAQPVSWFSQLRFVCRIARRSKWATGSATW